MQSIEREQNMLSDHSVWLAEQSARCSKINRRRSTVVFHCNLLATSNQGINFASTDRRM